MTQKSGRVTIKLNGDTLISKKGASLKLGGIKKTVEMSDQGGAYHTEEWDPSEVKATMLHVATTDMPAILAFTGVVSYETDTGVVYSIAGAVCTDLGELSNGEVEATFGGAPAEQA